VADDQRGVHIEEVLLELCVVQEVAAFLQAQAGQLAEVV
jgi:hypothetical protein